jgi:hypothetical protein
MLLAVDLGLRTGLAWYDPDGRLRAYRSQHYGSRGQLKRGVEGIVDGDVRHVVTEGDADLARIWARAAERRGARAHAVTPEQWRRALLHPSEQRGDPKGAADALARRVIDWSEATRRTSLRHDAAEAICIGLWGVLAVRWLDELPRTLRRHERPA